MMLKRRSDAIDSLLSRRRTKRAGGCTRYTTGSADMLLSELSVV